MAAADNYKIKPKVLMLDSAKKYMVAHILYLPNRLYEEPSSADKVYLVDGTKFGQPKFRIKMRDGGGITANSEAFWFSEIDTDKKYKLNCIIEIYRPEPDVHPLTPANPSITLSFQSGGKKVVKKLSIIQSPLINAVNILQDLHAETTLDWEEVKDLIIDLGKDVPATFNLDIEAELNWNLIPVNDPPEPKPQPDPVWNDPVIRDHRGGQSGWPKRQVPFMARMGVIADARMQRAPGGVMMAQRVPPVFSSSPPAAPPPPAQVPLSGKIGLRHTEIRMYTKSDISVFGAFSEQFEIKSLVWRSESLTKDSGNYTINYRPTSNPGQFYFLPQEFRIAVNEYSGEPKIAIAMVPVDGDATKPDTYRIKISIQLIQYFNPKAKKDLYLTLDKESNGVIKYCELRMGGYNAAQFTLRGAYAGENSVFSGKVPDTIDKIDPVSGFTLTVDCSLESFDFFKREITNGFSIGDIVFDLPFENAQGPQILKQAVPVYLDIRKLAGIPVGSGVIETEDKISGFKLMNPNKFPLSIKGAELTLLSDIGETVYDADYEIGIQSAWPQLLDAGKECELHLKAEDIASLAEGVFWTKLEVEPSGISLTEDAEVVLARVIDYATGDPEVWNLQINCPLFERWAELDADTLKPYQQISRVEVEVMSGDAATFSVNLNKTTPVGTIKMARSISQILKSQQLTERTYKYRVGTHYILDDSKWTDWLTPEAIASNFLSIRPQKLTA